MSPGTPDKESEPGSRSHQDAGEADEEANVAHHQALVNAARNATGQDASLQKLRNHFHKVSGRNAAPFVWLSALL